MADIKISDMTTDTSISGAEVFPVSDAGAAKKISVSGVKDFTVDAIRLSRREPHAGYVF